MRSNFKISFHRNSENVHLKLAGDFDEFSAYGLDFSVPLRSIAVGLQGPCWRLIGWGGGSSVL